MERRWSVYYLEGQNRIYADPLVGGKFKIYALGVAVKRITDHCTQEEEPLPMLERIAEDWSAVPGEVKQLRRTIKHELKRIEQPTD